MGCLDVLRAVWGKNREVMSGTEVPVAVVCSVLKPEIHGYRQQVRPEVKGTGCSSQLFKLFNTEEVTMTLQ